MTNTTMNTLITKRFVSIAAATTVALLHAAGASAAPKEGVPLMNERAAANLADLPAIAKAKSGVMGALNGNAFGASAVALTLSDGRTVTARLQRVARDGAKATQSWVGTFDEQPGSILVLTKAKGVVTGFASYGPETWEIMPSKGGKSMLYQVDDAKLPKAEHVLRQDTATQPSVASDYGVGASADATTGYVHDLLVVYTPAAKAAYGQSTLESMITNAVAAANQAYLNSKINITLKLVGLQEISYTETGTMKTSLFDLQGTSDGKMDAVHKLRDSVGADIVTLVSQDSSSCGIAWVMKSVSSSFAPNAFNVVKPSCLSQHTLAHEVGHNQGNEHDRESSVGYYGAYPYSYGFRRCVSDGTGFRTVMSYACSGASRVAWFSNPNAYYNGHATGISYETNAANSSENARSMNNTASTVAAFRGSAGGTAPVAPSAPSSLSASATAYNSVTVRWSDNSGDESGFKVERSLDGVSFTEIATLGAGSTSFVDGSVQAQRNYWYRARAYSSAGNSAYSNAGSVTTPSAPATAPAAPSSLSANATAYNSVTVRWSDNSSNETGFRLERSVSGGSYALVASVGAGVTSYVDGAVQAERTYAYRVLAYNGGGNSSYSNAGSVTTPAAPVATALPSIPTSIAAANNGDGTALVSWGDGCTRETGFEVRRETYDSKKKTWKSLVLVGTVPANQTSLIDASGAGTFRYTVRAVNSGGASSSAGPASVTVTAPTKAKGRPDKKK